MEVICVESKKLLQEICDEDGGCNKENCFLRFLILNNPLSDRQIMQIKLIDKFKYEWSYEDGNDIGIDKSMQKWIDLGYAELYAKYWDQGDHTHHINEMYKALKRG